YVAPARCGEGGDVTAGIDTLVRSTGSRARSGATPSGARSAGAGAPRNGYRLARGGIGLALLAVALAPARSWAQAGGTDRRSDPELRRELDQMLQRQDSLERENQQLRQQVGALEDRLGGSGGTTPAVAARAADEKPPVGLNPGGGGVYIGGK